MGFNFVFKLILLPKNKVWSIVDDVQLVGVNRILYFSILKLLPITALQV